MLAHYCARLGSFVLKNPYLILGFLFLSYSALAQVAPVIIGDGENQSQQMGAVANMVKTLQHVAYNWIAPLCGTFLAIYGIYKIAVRETMVGTVALVCGGAMFFVQKIIEGLQKITGN